MTAPTANALTPLAETATMNVEYALRKNVFPAILELSGLPRRLSVLVSVPQVSKRTPSPILVVAVTA